jgi:hypothetical protein
LRGRKAEGIRERREGRELTANLLSTLEEDTKQGEGGGGKREMKKLDELSVIVIATARC